MPRGSHIFLTHTDDASKFLLDFWPGVYRIASETGAPVVPIIHYIYDPTLQIDSRVNLIHTVVDEPIDIAQFSEKAGLNYLREVMGTWYYLMMEKYGKTTRKELIGFYEKRALARDKVLKEEDFKKRPLTAHETYELYLLDLLETVDWYDSEIERNYDYRPKEITRADAVWKSVAAIQNVNPQNADMVLFASKEMGIRQREDYQRRY